MGKGKKNLHDMAEDHQSAERAEKQANLKVLQEREDFRYLLGLKQFRGWVYRLIKTCFEDETTFTGNSHTFKNEGERQVALDIKKDIKETDFKAWLKMQEEDYMCGIVQNEKEK